MPTTHRSVSGEAIASGEGPSLSDDAIAAAQATPGLTERIAASAAAAEDDGGSEIDPATGRRMVGGCFVETDA